MVLNNLGKVVNKAYFSCSQGAQSPVGVEVNGYPKGSIAMG